MLLRNKKVKSFMNKKLKKMYAKDFVFASLTKTFYEDLIFHRHFYLLAFFQKFFCSTNYL